MTRQPSLRTARTILSILVALVTLLALGPALPGKAAAAGDDSFSRQSLRGLKALYLLVEDVDPELVKAGLTRERIAEEAEKRLRSVPLRVMTLKESFQETGRPYLEIAFLLAKPQSGAYGYFIEVSVSQEVRPTRPIPGGPYGGGQGVHCQTWSIRQAGVVERDRLSSLAETVGTMVDRFVDAHQSVNKDLRSGAREGRTLTLRELGVPLRRMK